MNSKITPTIEGGLLTAIAVILGLAAIYLPVLGLFVEFFCAVPIVVLTVRQGIGKGFLAFVASLLILAMFIGPVLAMNIALSFEICGLVLGYCIQKNFSTAKCFVATFIAAFFAQILSVAILAVVMGINMMESEISAMQEMFEDSFKLYETLGVDQNTINQVRGQVAPTLQLMSYLMPFILALMGLVNAITCYLTSKWIFAKLHLKFIEPFPKFAEWRFSKIFLYVATFAAIGVYWGVTRDWKLLYTISVNISFLATGIGFLQGLAVMSAIADKFNLSKFWRRLIFIIIIFNMMFITIVSFTGFFDMAFDYRKRLKNNEQ